MLEGSPIRGHSGEGIVKIFERKNQKGLQMDCEAYINRVDMPIREVSFQPNLEKMDNSENEGDVQLKDVLIDVYPQFEGG